MNLLDLARSVLPTDAPVRTATPLQAAELSALVPEVCRLAGEDDVPGCLAAALADPADALTSYRALLAELSPPSEVSTDDPKMRTCRHCRNLSAGGSCLAAARGESFGDGCATSRNSVPVFPDRPQRCGAYSPTGADPDQRPGRERWPFLFRKEAR